jgi:hypothetical protein
MRLLSFLPLMLTAAVAAQVPGIEIYPGTTSFTSRGNVGTGAGEIHQGFHESHWKGIGDTGAGAFINGVTITTQDQNASTQETYDVVLRLGTDAAGPTTGVAGELSVTGPFMTPLGGNAPAAWVITHTFGTPTRIPSKGFFSAGLRLVPAAWTADGQSIHMSDQAVQQSGPHQGDHTWQIIGAATSATHLASKRSARIKVLTGTPILQNGVFATTTATYSRGMGGMFPPIGTHGWSTHVDGGTPFANGVAGIFMSPTVVNPGLALPGIRGLVYLGAGLVPLATVGLDANGRANVSIVDPIGMYTVTVNNQAILVDTTFTNIAMSNTNATEFQ